MPKIVVVTGAGRTAGRVKSAHGAIAVRFPGVPMR